MRRILLAAIIVNIVLALSVIQNNNTVMAQVQENTDAIKNNIKVYVDGDIIEFDQPPIIVDGRTLVPIRAVVERIGANVEWDGNNRTILVTKDQLELELQIGREWILKNGSEIIRIDVAAQIYNDRTLLPIRSVIEILGGEVKWDEEKRKVIIEYANITHVKDVSNTQINIVHNWARVSSVQQFLYKDEGIGYAYVMDEKLKIELPNNSIFIDMKYPLLGDIITDKDGNIFIVWGRNNQDKDTTIETIFISKYSSKGEHIKTTGFIGESPLGERGNTRFPFSSGKCVGVIGDGKLMVNYARQMNGGHQANNVIGVYIDDMSPVKQKRIPYVSHSFNQSVIWSEMYKDFIYADHGDAFGRGFIITTNESKNLIFHFYLESNVNYNMRVVNRTFAQMGDIVETSEGVVLVGASAKSISEDAKEEKQNLFIQIFNPLAKKVSSSIFIGGEERRGATSFDIYDNNNSPLTEAVDYGVHWLTDYTETDVLAPQAVVVDDKIVILWSTKDDSFYMVLSARGEVLIPETSLNEMVLNSYEKPIFYDGKIQWVRVINGRLKVKSLKI